MADDTYKVVIGAKLNGVMVYFDLDTCVARSLTSSATVTSFPIENGLSASDHMYRNPRTFTLSGTFSLNRGGHSIKDSYTMDAIQSWHSEGGTVSWEDWLQNEGAALKSLNAENYLQSVQTVFEYIQEKGILCQIMMTQNNKESSPRFKVRDNMVLQNIQWQEQYNSMTYSFTFQEVITVIKEQEFETFGYNELYPSVYLPATKSIGELVSETGSLYESIIQTLYENGYIGVADGYTLSLINSKNSFWKMVGDISKQFIPYTIGGVAIAGGIILGVSSAKLAASAISTIIAGGSAGGPVGLAIAGIIISIGLIAFGANRIIKSYTGVTNIAKRRNHFNLVRDYSKYVDPETLGVINPVVNEDDIISSEITRLRLFLNSVQANINNTITNISFYQISTGETDNEERECPIQIGNDLLTIRINKTNDPDTPFSMHLFRFNGGETETEIAPYTSGWPAIGNLYWCSRSSNVVYVDKTNQYEMYLYNPYLEDDVRKAKGYTEEKAKANLCNYYFVVSKGNIEDNMKKLSDAIDSSFTANDFKV